MKKDPPSLEFLMDKWLDSYFGISTDWLVEHELEFIKTKEWFNKYAVTQEQHDEWYEWAIDYIAKYYRWSKKRARQEFAFPYLNCSPSIKKEK